MTSSAVFNGGADRAPQDDPTAAGGQVPSFWRSRWMVALVLAGCLTAVGAAWSLSSPVGSSPDDNFHLASIWCSATARGDTCTEVGKSRGNRDVLVPAGIAEDVFCFVFDPTKSAECQANLDRSGSATAAANDGAYPDGFYNLMGLLVSSSAARSVVSMRMLGWALAMACIVAAAALAQGRLRRAYVLAVLATYVPLGLFLFASTNPSGLAIAGIGSFWVCGCVLMTTDDATRRWVAAGVGIASAALALGSRADAGLYIAATVVAVLCFSRGWRRPLWRRSAALGSVAVIGAATLLLGTQTAVAANGLAPPSDRNLLSTLWYNLVNLPSLWTGSIGTSNLGWLDTQMPSVVGGGLVALFGALAFWGLARIDRTALLAAAVAASSIIIAPLLVLAGSRNIIGENVQPRYLLPMLPIVLGFLLIGPDGGPIRRFSRAQRSTIVVVLVVAQSIALHANLRRYVTGQDELGFDLGAGEWWWPIAVGPMIVWAVGSVAFGGCVVLGLKLADGHSIEPDPAATPDGSGG